MYKKRVTETLKDNKEVLIVKVEYFVQTNMFELWGSSTDIIINAAIWCDANHNENLKF